MAIYTRLSVICLDEFKIGVWKDVSEIQDPSLVALASTLPRVVLSAKARNTTVRYAYGWNRWKTWCKSKIGVTFLPAPPMFVALYLHHLLTSARKTSPIDTAVYSIRWGHNLAGLTSPTEHPLVQSTYEGWRRILARPREPKEPVQPHMLAKLIQKHGQITASPADLRLLFIVLVGYSGFLRISEILAMEVRRIRLMPEGMSVFLPQRKNDQFRDGNTIYIAKTSKLTCPVSITKRLLQMLPDDGHLCYPAVRRVQNKKGIQRSISHAGFPILRLETLSERAWGYFLTI